MVLRPIRELVEELVLTCGKCLTALGSPALLNCSLLCLVLCVHFYLYSCLISLRTYCESHAGRHYLIWEHDRTTITANLCLLEP